MQSIQIRGNTDKKKTPYLDTFQKVLFWISHRGKMFNREWAQSMIINVYLFVYIIACWDYWVPVLEPLNNKVAGLIFTTWKESKYGVFSGLYFHVFGLNTEIYLLYCALYCTSQVTGSSTASKQPSAKYRICQQRCEKSCS